MASKLSVKERQEQKSSQPQRQSRRNSEVSSPQVRSRQKTTHATHELLSDWKDAS